MCAKRFCFRLYKHFFESAIFISILLFLFSAAQSQSNVKFTHLTNLDGLSQSTVQAIIKDHYGFMWFGTQDGLNRYDGYRFKVYRHIPKDTNSLRRSHIMCLYEDRQNNLWVGTSNGGLSLYERKHDHFVHYKEATADKPGLSNKYITTLYEDKQNNFWVGTYWKLNLLDRKTGKVIIYGNDPANPSSISNDNITCIYEDSRNNLWIGTINGLNLFDCKTKKFKRFFHTNDATSLTDNFISAIHEDNYGRLWIGTMNGLNIFDATTEKSKRFQQIPNDSKSLASNLIAGVDEAEDGKLWIGTKSSLDLFDPAANTFTHFNSNTNSPTALSKNANVTAMYKDPQGAFWVGTYQGGINKYDKKLSFFDLYHNNPEDWQSLSFNIVNSFAENADGDVWIGTSGGALNLWKRKTNTFQRFNPDASNRDSLSTWGLLCLCQSKKNGFVWIGTYGSCIDRYDPKTKIFKHFTKGERRDQLNNDAVYAITEDSKGNIWMGTNGGGVNVLNPATGIITKYLTDPNNENTLPSNYVRCFFEDSKGNMWIGTVGGISVFNPLTKLFTNYNQGNTSLESDIIFSLFEDSKGNMWVGTLGGGLNLLDRKNRNIVTYTTDNGLADNTINGITEDDKGYLWISTNNGVSRFNPSTKTFKYFGIENGIQSFEFSQGAILKTRSGEILLGGINGFNAIHPNTLIENETIPPVVITGLRIFNKPINASQENSPLKDDILSTKEITLSYNQSVISFDFTALNFTAADKNQYAYMLEGFDKTWIYCGNNRTATYTNLDPGEYVFHVKGSNNDGLWNNKGASIRIIISPPFWDTWWFKLLALSALVAGILAIYKIRVRTIELQRRRLEQVVSERTQSLELITAEEKKARQEADEANKELEKKNKELEQFAYVASHDLQEPLRTISSFLNLLNTQYKDGFDDKASKYMAFILQASDRMKVLINDLLEYSRIGRKKESASINLNLAVKEVLADLNKAISDAGADVTLEELPDITAYPTEIKQIFQNLIINAIKFRKKDVVPQIRIKAERKEGSWQFVVKDNGIGIDPKQSERIFVIFQRLHTRNEYEGSGIGLSHCKKIAELHKGKIWVESTPGEGSSFYFTIRDNIQG